MKKETMIVTLLAVALIGLPLIYAVSKYNSFVQQENGIVAVHEDMKNVHSSIFNQIKSQGLSVEKYGDLVIKAIDAAVGKRYGANGIQSAMAWIKEQNPTIDSKVFGKLQVAIEAGYNKFESTQRTKIDRLRIYDNDREVFPGSMVASIFGFPKKVTQDMRTTISSGATDEVMASKQLKTINPFAER